MILGAHGLFTWADDQHDCYETTIATINKAIAWLAEQTKDKPAFGGEVVAALPDEERRTIAAALMPKIRGLIGTERPKVGHFDDQPAVLTFVGSKRFEELAALGTSCPDHFLRTKIRPLVLPFDPETKDDAASLDRETCPMPSPPIGPTTPRIGSGAAIRTARRCATRTRSST